MLGIIKKDLWFALLSPVLLCPLLAIYWISSRDFLDYQMAYSTGSFLLMFIANSILMTEINEDKNKGYAFLKILPVEINHIVRAKFMLVLLLDVVLVAYAFIMFQFFPSQGDTLKVGMAMILLCAAIVLIPAGLLYLGLFKFGFTRLMKVVLYALPPLCVIIPIILEELFYAGKLNPDIAGLTRYMTTLNIVLFCVAGAAIYMVLMRLAARALKTAEPDRR